MHAATSSEMMEHGDCLVERDMISKSRSPNEGFKFVRISNAGPSLIIVQ